MSASATRRTGLLLLTPAVIALLCLFLAPQLIMVAASFARRSAYGTVEHALTLDNYRRALQPLYLRVIARSVGLAAFTTLLCLVLGFPVAWWVARVAPPRFRRLLLVLAILPFWTSFLVRMYAWVFLLRTEGLVNALLGRAGIGPLPLLYNDFAVMLGQVYGELPFMILPLFASMEKLDGSLLEAAADLGAKPAEILRRVILPLVRPGIAAGAILVFIPSLGSYLAPDLLGGARTVYVGTLVQNQFVAARDAPFGAALSLLLSLLAFAALYVLRRAENAR